MKVQNLLSLGRGAAVAATMTTVAAALVVQAPMAQAAGTAKALSCEAHFNHNPMLIKGGVGVSGFVSCEEKPTRFHVFLALEYKSRGANKWVNRAADETGEIPNVWYNILAYNTRCEDGAWRATLRIDVESGGKQASDDVESPPTIINCNQ
ncbi:hypothetical protein ABTW96_11065 [Nocardia beijingensis]|uniref:hypothetical protein n=1 Tax=Nocardia beijingensis TaxID=95162 RepID=UPI0033256FAE